MAEKTPKSCIPGEPLIDWCKKKEDCAKLCCNIPVKTCLSPRGRIFISIDSDKFKKETHTPPRDNYWDTVVNQEAEAISNGIKDDLQTGVTTSAYVGNFHELVRGLDNEVTQTVELPKHTEENANAFLKNDFMGNTNTPKVNTKLNKGLDVDYITQKIKNGARPLIVRSLSGKSAVNFIEKPKQPTPGIYIIEQYHICSYLGDYGAGRTINSFSLLPGEKTTISLTSWQDQQSTRKFAESILDSFSDSSADFYESYVQSESSTSVDKVTNLSGSVNVNISVGGGLAGLVGVGGGASLSASASYNVKRSELHKTLSHALSKHLSSSNHHRQSNINTSTSVAVEQGQTSSIVRHLKNINYSRVLNFVFRELVQQYFVINYLSDIKILYTNGYPESVKIVDLPELMDLLTEVINPKDVQGVFDDIINKLCHVYNYKDKEIPFLEQVKEKVGGCIGTDTKTITYWRVKKGLEDKYNDIVVPGIILDVNEYIMKTPAVIVDALLGNGEALDCYNMRLQDAASKEAELANKITEQMISVIGNIPDPEKAAKLYKKVFGDCCDVPQSGCCCDCDKKEIKPTPITK